MRGDLRETCTVCFQVLLLIEEYLSDKRNSDFNVLLSGTEQLQQSIEKSLRKALAEGQDHMYLRT